MAGLGAPMSGKLPRDRVWTHRTRFIGSACSVHNGKFRMSQPPILLAFRGAEVDEAIIVRLQRCEPQALAEFYDRYGRIAYALILHVVRDTGIAEDLVHETFLRVWDRLQTFDAQKGVVGPWLLAVAHNRAIDYLRSAGGRERNAVEFEETDHFSLYTDIEPRILASDKRAS
jgi:hypothetical protein